MVKSYLKFRLWREHSIADREVSDLSYPSTASWLLYFHLHHGTNLVPVFLEVYINQIFQYYPFILKMGKCVFSAKWKADERFKVLIAADPKSRTKAKCTVCDKAIDISSMGEAALVSHMLGKKHKNLMQIKRLSFSVTHFVSTSMENER